LAGSSADPAALGQTWETTSATGSLIARAPQQSQAQAQAQAVSIAIAQVTLRGWREVRLQADRKERDSRTSGNGVAAVSDDRCAHRPHRKLSYQKLSKEVDCLVAADRRGA